ncbi:MAG: type II secretion system F family protein [Pseudonocardiaceae bacterium]
MARSLRSGASLPHAIEEGAENVGGMLGQELNRVTAEIGTGCPLTEALDALAVRQSSPQMALVVAALCLGYEAGGAQARALDGLAVTLRANLALGSEVRALSSQARISALVIGLAPLVFALFAVATDSRTGSFLFGSVAGILLLAAGLSLDIIGWIWMRRLCGPRP